jgi:maltose alpha-D-glucosyltransferase/alpha-amylase
MQWTAKQKDNGYLPIDRSKDAPNVAAQEKQKNSMLNVTRALVKLRRTEPALAADAKIDVLYVKKQKCPLIFLRSKGREKILVAFNPSKSDVSAPLATGEGRLLAGSGAKLENGRCIMQGRSYGIWKV